MKILRLLALFGLMLASPSLGLAQSYYTDRAVGTSQFNGFTGLVPISYGQVRICSLPTSGSPCNTPVTVLDATTLAPLAVVGGNFGQVTTDVVGRFQFNVASGDYQIQVAASGSNTPQLNYRVTIASSTAILGSIAVSASSTGATAAARMDAACNNYVLPLYGTTLIPSYESSGMTTTQADNCTLWDLRSTEGPNQYGETGTAFSHGWNMRWRWTSDNSKPPTTNQTFNSLRLFTDIIKGGRNTGVLGAVNKSNYQAVAIQNNMHTPGQLTGLGVGHGAYSMGDSQPLVSVIYSLGGHEIGFGDEGAIPFRAFVGHEGTVFVGTVTAINGNTLTLSASGGASALGRQQMATLGAGRPLIITSRATSSAGQAAVASGATAVVGSGGSLFTNMGSGAVSNVFFWLQAEVSGNLKLVVPVTNIASDIAATIQHAWGADNATAAGAYTMYKGSIITEVNTGTSVNVGDVTVQDGTTFLVGDSVENPPSDMFYGLGEFIVMNQAIHSNNFRGGGFAVNNQGVKQDSFLGALGNFYRGIYWAPSGGATQTPLALIHVQPSGGTGVPSTWFNMLDDKNNSFHTIFALNKNAGTWTFTYNKSGDVVSFTNQTSVTISPTAASSNEFEVSNGGAPDFRVGNTATLFNLANDAIWFVNNQSGEVARVNGTTGLAHFDGGVCTNNGSTVCITSGAGAPAGACTTGSLYQRTDGGAATTLYVCEAAAWAAK